MDRYRVAIVGAGVSGAAIARRLSGYDIRIALIEGEADVSFGTSKANSGIIHGGFHHKRTYLKARLEIQGAGMYPQLHRELGFPYRRCGILVAAFTPEELSIAEHLYRQGVENDSAGIELCGAERIVDLEPKLHPDVIGGVYAPAGGIIEPYRFVFALVENAEANGVDVLREFRVVRGERRSDRFIIHADDGRKVSADYVVNAAGLFADDLSRMFGAESYRIVPRKGEYHLLDRRTPACPSRVIFPVPTPVSKGMLVIPTVEGTVLLGPTADPQSDKHDVSTHRDKMAEIIASARQLVPSVSANDVIASFSGLRPTLESDDFLIEESTLMPGFIHVAGIQSPGLTAAPAVAEYVKELVKAAGCRLTEKTSFSAMMPETRRTRLMDDAELESAWERDHECGNVVCRCETVTRADVVQAIRAGHATLDGIKFTSRAGAGRCQGSFCTPRLLEIVAEETGTPITSVTKRGAGSEVASDVLPGTPAERRPRHRQDLAAARSRDGGVSGGGLHGSSSRTVARRAKASVDVLVIGGGAAGLAAAAEVASRGFEPLIVDREPDPGGVLRQCIHNGFGIHEYGEELTGPEYAIRSLDRVTGAGVAYHGSTTVLGIERDGSGFSTRILSGPGGLERVRSRAVVLAMGSRERNRGSIQIPGDRPAGILTAGAAQRLINIEGVIPGRRAVIVGSGDIGLIMARRLKLVGCDVEAVVEIQPVPSGINRNIVQCLDDFAIPLFLGHVVTAIHGRRRVERVTVAPLENGVPREDRALEMECDTVLLSVGLIPENELSRELGVELHRQTNGPLVDCRLMTSVPGVFAAGNVLHIHDLVDYVTEESRRAGTAVADYLDGQRAPPQSEVRPGSNVRYVIPGAVRRDGVNRIYLR